MKNGSEYLEISVKATVFGSASKVFSQILRLSEFEKFMYNVRESRLLERVGNTSLMNWVVEVDGIPIRWLERNEINRSKMTVQFKSLDGDFETFDGHWMVTREGTQTFLELNARIKMGIPSLQQVVGQALKKKVEENFKSMIQMIDSKLRGEFYRAPLRTTERRHFALIGHPYDYAHMVRHLKNKNPGMKVPSSDFLTEVLRFTPAYKSYDIKPLSSPTGKGSSGHFIVCPIIPAMIKHAPELAFQKVVEACKVAEDLRCGIVCLGGFTSIALEWNSRLFKDLVQVPVTTGNTFTAALAVEGIVGAARLMDLPLERAKLVIVGGSGDIGSACALALCDLVEHTILIARNIDRLQKTREKILSRHPSAKISIGTDYGLEIATADIVIGAASSPDTCIDVDNFKSGAIVCDVGYPKNVRAHTARRDDILVFSGGLCSLPSEFDVGSDLDYGLHNDKILYGCFAESIVLDLERRYESFSFGKGNISRESMQDIMKMARSHGFDLAPYYSGNQLLEKDQIKKIKESAEAKRM